MTQFPNFKKFTLMEQSESTASDSTKGVTAYLHSKDGKIEFDYIKNIGSVTPLKLVPSDSTKELSAEEVYYKYLSESIVGSQNYIRSIAAMKEYASQKDAQIQALTKEVDRQKKLLLHYEINVIADKDAEYERLIEAGNKMAEALKETKGVFPFHDGSLTYTESNTMINIEQALKEWEKLNK